MSAPAMVCAAVEVALNRYLRLESAVIEQCAQLDGRSIAVSLPSSAFSAVIEFMPGGVRVLPEIPTRPSVSVTGTPSAFLRALRSEAPAGAGLDVEGDAELLERFSRMMHTVGFDPEEWLAPLLGDALSHRVAGGLDQALGWLGLNSRRMADHTAEYLREESYDLARDRDAARWMDQVDQLREGIDRAEARVARVEKQRAAQDREAS